MKNVVKDWKYQRNIDRRRKQFLTRKYKQLPLDLRF